MDICVCIKWKCDEVCRTNGRPFAAVEKWNFAFRFVSLGCGRRSVCSVNNRRKSTADKISASDKKKRRWKTPKCEPNIFSNVERLRLRASGPHLLPFSRWKKESKSIEAHRNPRAQHSAYLICYISFLKNENVRETRSDFHIATSSSRISNWLREIRLT